MGNETVTVGNGQELLVTHVGHGELKTSTHNFRLNNILRVPIMAVDLMAIDLVGVDLMSVDLVDVSI